MEYEVIVTPCAEQDYGEIVHYLGDVLHSRQAVASFVRRLDECLHHLQETPEMYEFSQEPLLRARGYRKFLIGNYVALYLVDGVDRAHFPRFTGLSKVSLREKTCPLGSV